MKKYINKEKILRKYHNFKEGVRFIWGVKSELDNSDYEAGLLTPNDIDLFWIEGEKKYALVINHCFDSLSYEENCTTLIELLDYFTSFMLDNNYFINFIPHINNDIEVFNQTYLSKSIEELYENFRIYVIGYYKYNSNNL